MRAEQVMSANVHTVNRQSTLEQAGDRMRRHGIHHLVVLDAGVVVGIVTAEGVRWGEAEGIARIEDVMDRRVVSAPPRLPVEQIARLLNDQRTGALPICDGRRLVGIVTTRDLVGMIGRGVAPQQRPQPRVPLRLVAARQKPARRRPARRDTIPD